jgi:hypothetical protein
MALVLGLLVAAGLVTVVPPVFAEFIQVKLSLDKVAYVPSDEAIRVTGCLSSDSPSVLGRQVTIQVFGPDGGMISSEPVSVDDACAFGVNIDTRNLSEHGDYMVVASHQTASDKRAFRFSDESNLKQEGECEAEYCTYFIELSGTIYGIQYKLSSGKLDSVVGDPPSKSLKFLVNSTAANGTLTVVLPGNVIDSAQNGTDIRYKVFVGSLTDGVEHVLHSETKLDAGREIAVYYDASNDHILVTISGTFLVPESGELFPIASALAIAMAVLVRYGRGILTCASPVGNSE